MKGAAPSNQPALGADAEAPSAKAEEDIVKPGRTQRKSGGKGTLRDTAEAVFLGALMTSPLWLGVLLKKRADAFLGDALSWPSPAELKEALLICMLAGAAILPVGWAVWKWMKNWQVMVAWLILLSGIAFGTALLGRLKPSILIPEWPLLAALWAAFLMALFLFLGACVSEVCARTWARFVRPAARDASHKDGDEVPEAKASPDNGIETLFFPMLILAVVVLVWHALLFAYAGMSLHRYERIYGRRPSSIEGMVIVQDERKAVWKRWTALSGWAENLLVIGVGVVAAQAVLRLRESRATSAEDQECAPPPNNVL